MILVTKRVIAPVDAEPESGHLTDVMANYLALTFRLRLDVRQQKGASECTPTFS
jgi:hypothetical protein